MDGSGLESEILMIPGLEGGFRLLMFGEVKDMIYGKQTSLGRCSLLCNFPSVRFIHG